MVEKFIICEDNPKAGVEVVHGTNNSRKITQYLAAGLGMFYFSYKISGTVLI